MNYKQQIEQKAREYAGIDIDDDLGHYQKSHDYEIRSMFYLYRAYKTGMETMREIANTWIPIEERLPENKDIVLVMTNNECVMTAYLHGKESGFICYGDDAYDGVGVVTHWKPITL